MNIAAVSSSNYSAASNATAGANVVRNSGQGLVIETLGKLKISEIDGKNVTSMYGSGPGEGEVLNRVQLGGSKPAAPIPDLYTGEDTAQPVSVGGAPAAASFAYQAVSGLGGAPAATSTFSVNG